MAKQPLTFRRVTHPAALVPLKAVERGLVAQVTRGPKFCGATRALMHTIVRATKIKDKVVVTGIYLAEFATFCVTPEGMFRVLIMQLASPEDVARALRQYDTAQVATGAAPLRTGIFGVDINGSISRQLKTAALGAAKLLYGGAPGTVRLHEIAYAVDIGEIYYPVIPGTAVLKRVPV